jgi:hypothetical protein
VLLPEDINCPIVRVFKRVTPHSWCHSNQNCLLWLHTILWIWFDSQYCYDSRLFEVTICSWHITWSGQINMTPLTEVIICSWPLNWSGHVIMTQLTEITVSLLVTIFEQLVYFSCCSHIISLICMLTWAY